MRWVDWPRVIARGFPFNFCIGARGIGKTYGLLQQAQADDWRYIYLRRTDTELDLSASKEANPFRKLNSDHGWDIEIKGHGKLRTIERGDPAETVGYASALSTFGNFRGMDFSHIGQIIFDEFIPSPQARPIKDEGPALMQLYETVNRNRELEGIEPVRMFLLANALSLASPILSYLDLISPIETMVRKGREEWSDDARGVFIYLPHASEVSAEKRDTALYKLVSDEGLIRQNLSNEFVSDSMYNVRREPLREYYPMCSYEDLFIYRHKSDNRMYVCRSRADCIAYSKDTKATFIKYQGLYLKEDVMADRIRFCDYAAKVKLYNILNIPLT